MGFRNCRSITLFQHHWIVTQGTRKRHTGKRMLAPPTPGTQVGIGEGARTQSFALVKLRHFGRFPRGQTSIGQFIDVRCVLRWCVRYGWNVACHIQPKFLIHFYDVDPRNDKHVFALASFFCLRHTVVVFPFFRIDSTVLNRFRLTFLLLRRATIFAIFRVFADVSRASARIWRDNSF